MGLSGVKFMHSFSAICRKPDIAVSIHAPAPSHRNEAAVDVGPDRLPFILTWQIVDMAPHIIATTSILNAMFEDPESIVTTDTLKAYLPARLERYFPIISLSASTAEACSWHSFIAEVLRHHDGLISRTAAFCAEESYFSIRSGVDATDLVRDWREQCAGANQVISGLAHSDARSGERSGLLVPRLMSELAQASEGLWPSITSNGGVRLARLARSRQSPRWPVAWDAELLVEMNAIPIQIRDISSSGFGFITRLDCLNCGEIVLKFANGRRLEARVIWLNDGRGGAEFSQPLNAVDPLLNAARAMANIQS